jgi:hypothetical protein
MDPLKSQVCTDNELAANGESRLTEMNRFMRWAREPSAVFLFIAPWQGYNVDD